MAVSFGFGTASKDGPKDGEAAAALHGKGGQKTCFFLPLFVVYIYFVVLFAFCIVFCIVCIGFSLVVKATASLKTNQTWSGERKNKRGGGGGWA